MQLSVKAFALTMAVVGAVAMSVTALLAMLIPSWGDPLMRGIGVVAPGVTGANWSSLLLVTGYAVVDGIMFGTLFAWVYNSSVQRARGS